MYFLPFELWRWWLIDYNDNKNYFSVQVGDYWVIYLLSKNLNPIAMKELLEELKPVKQKKNKQNMTFGELQVMAPATNIYKPAYPEMDEKESPM